MDKPLLINSQLEYEEKLEEVKRLVRLDPELKSIDGIRLHFLGNQVEIYEELHFDFGAKLLKARKIREEIECWLQNNGNHGYFSRGEKCQLTKIIKRNL